MWGAMFRISGSRVETNIEGFLSSAAGTHAVIDFINCVARELARAPDVYGFDPDNIYTLLVQTWDRAFLNIQSVALGRQVVGQEAVGLIPDIYYISGRGFELLRRDASSAPAWRDREAKVVWRGSVTGSGPYAAAEEIPRIKLTLACRDLAAADVRLISVHPTMHNVFSAERIDEVIAERGLKGDWWPMPAFGNYRFAVDIDGHANAWGLLEKLILGCCILKVDSPYEQWFYKQMRPWTHYVPIKADLSDLHDKIDWCLSNDDACEWIADNGRRLAAALAFEAELPRSCATIMAAMEVAPR